MADANRYTSNYTGAQIDQAVAAYLELGARAKAIVTITEGDWKDGDTSLKYKIEIATSSNVSFGAYPDVFLVSNGERIIPAVSYSDDGKTITIWSNKKLSQAYAVIYGAMESATYKIQGTQEPSK